jgi:outer membrane protein OmpA-like peptidoglycan-associated protein
VRDARGQFSEIRPIIAHQLLLHVDLAGSFLDRVNVALSLPVTLLERGEAAVGVGPLDGAGVGDPRVSALVRIWRHADRDPISIHAGLDLFIPIKQSNHQGDDGVRVRPKVVLAGFFRGLSWSFLGAFYYRPEASLGTVPAGAGNSVGSEIQLGARIGYWDQKRAWSIAPEALLSTVVIGGKPFQKSYTSLELLLGGHYSIKRQVLVGAAFGLGALREPGSPDFRFLFRAAYAPERHDRPALPPSTPRDRDHDGIPDDVDRCPDVAEDKDGFQDSDGCPDPDNDEDGIPDVKDRCPNEPEDRDTFEDDDGCPEADNDQDGILDKNDECRNAAEDKDGFEDSDGCPDPDNDKDGIVDADDKCPIEPGPVENGGCPDKDRDGDTVVDRLDNCPDEPGDPANKGCKKKQLAEIRSGQILILENVYFKTDKAVIEARSFALLKNVAAILKSHPEIGKILVEGHTDDKGKLAHNMDLSQRRAESVVSFLVKEGVARERLEARGFGPTVPIAENKTAEGRARNRRVVFTIVGANPAPGVEVQRKEGAPPDENLLK